MGWQLSDREERKAPGWVIWLGMMAAICVPTVLWVAAIEKDPTPPSRTGTGAEIGGQVIEVVELGGEPHHCTLVHGEEEWTCEEAP